MLPTRFRMAPRWSAVLARPMWLVAGWNSRMPRREYEDLGAGLLRRDEVAAALVRAIREHHEVTMGEVRQGLAGAPLNSLPKPLQDFLVEVRSTPDWLNPELLRRGARALRRLGPDSHDVLMLGSLLGGYQSTAVTEPLARSGRLQGSDTLKRLGETGTWWLAVTAPGGLEPHAEGWRLSVHVRIMHAFINYGLERVADWDWAEKGMPINAVDSAATLHTFSTTFLIHIRLLGIRVSRADSRAIMHLWSYVGWLMGVEDQWLPRTERDGRRFMANLMTTLPPPDDTSRELAHSVIHTYDHLLVQHPWRRRLRVERNLSMGSYLLGPFGMRNL
ncbi:MAG TPA: oxygenase MpaB family protein, partial [Marmoricola sp.]|nr:oxygenase MpaB family protein [Marmoricola sp.]